MASFGSLGSGVFRDYVADATAISILAFEGLLRPHCKYIHFCFRTSVDPAKTGHHFYFIKMKLVDYKDTFMRGVVIFTLLVR